ncbi:DUF6493 family protein [Saccharopolyspora sp. NPDC050389]|uniref:DUF6493 family protein n=1 Tax=Saccharopolyspora sp. NPDC050389 TaxID=3155516 RepID=UPI003402FDD3
MNWDDLKELIEQGDLDVLAAALGEIGPADSRALTKPLTDFERSVRRADFYTTQQYSPMLAVAGAAVLPMSTLAPWLSRNSLDRPLRPDDRRVLRPYGAPAFEHVLAVLRRRDVPWLPRLAEKLAQRLRPRGRTSNHEWQLITAIAGDALPDSDGYVYHWPEMIGRDDTTIVGEIRGDRRFLALIPRLFEVDGVARRLADSWAQDGWPSALAELAAAGEVDRLVLLDGLLARLQRGGKQMDVVALIDLHDKLCPNLDELAPRGGDYAALVPDSHSTVAGMAQRELQRLDEANRLAADVLLDVSRAMFFRPEKKLVRAQISWLDKAIRRGRAGSLAVLGGAFGHESVDVQERALKLVLKHAGKLDANVRDELAEAAVALPQDLRARAADVFAMPEAEPEPVPVPAAAPRPEMPPPIASLDELVTAFAEQAHRAGPLLRERILAAMVEFAFTDREALRRAFAPLQEQSPWYTPGLPDWSEQRNWIGSPSEAGEFSAVLRAATGECRGEVTSPIPRIDEIPGEADWEELATRGVEYGTVRMRRLHEIGIGLAYAPRPFLMSTPTGTSGIIAPEALAERLERAAAQGFEPWQHDLVVAMLRLPRDAAIADRVRGLGEAGAQVARWIDDGGLGRPEIRRAVVPVKKYDWRGMHLEDHTRVTVTFPDTADPVRKSFDSTATGRYSATLREQNAAPDLMPAYRDLCAAHRVEAFADGARGSATMLGRLVDAYGPIGDGMNTVLAFALGARESADRASVVDALITLTARDGLRGTGVAHAVVELVLRDEVVLGRVVQTVRDAARAGLAELAWEVVAVLVEGLLPAEGERPRTALADLLALGVELVDQVRPAEPVPGVAAAAARGGSSRFVKEARRLHQALTTA